MPWYAKALLAVNGILKAFIMYMAFNAGRKSAQNAEAERDLDAAERIGKAHMDSPAGLSDLRDRLRKPGGKL